MRVLTSQQMRDADQQTTEEVGIASLVLMEHAGRQVVASMESACEGRPDLHVAVVCGKGNNGGDGFVVARTLHQRSIAVSVYLLGVSADVRGDARINLGVLRAMNLDVVEIADTTAWELHGSDVLGADLIVDAIVGTECSGWATGLVETVIADINVAATPVVPILPTGRDADTTARLVGSLVIADIGIPRGVFQGLDGPWLELITKERMRALVTPRVAESQKGDDGRVLVVAGSRGKTGAAYLAASAALRSDAGLVTVATAASCEPILAGLGVE